MVAHQKCARRRRFLFLKFFVNQWIKPKHLLKLSDL